VEKSLHLYRAAFSVNYFYQTLIVFLFANLILSLKLNFLLSSLLFFVLGSAIAVQLSGASSSNCSLSGRSSHSGCLSDMSCSR
jgi:hypothetical protein